MGNMTKAGRSAAVLFNSRSGLQENCAAHASGSGRLPETFDLRDCGVEGLKFRVLFFVKGGGPLSKILRCTQ